MAVAHPLRFPCNLKLNCSTKTRTLVCHHVVSTIKSGPGRTDNLLRAHIRGPTPELGRKRSHAVGYRPDLVSPRWGINHTEIVTFRKVAGICVRPDSPQRFCARNRSSSSWRSVCARPSASAAAKAFIVGP